MRDTSWEAERVLIDIFRKMSIQDKWRQWASSCRTARRLHAAGARLRNPQASAADIHRDWIERTLGPAFLHFGDTMAMEQQPTENLDVLQQVTAAFTRLGIPYALGGSLASSLLGRPRFTQDADVSVPPFPGKEEALAASFGAEFYVSLPAVRDAIRRRSSFNIIHGPTGFKVDVFISKDRPFDASLMARRRAVAVPDRPGETIDVVSAEDIILLKLEWFRLGNELSERQWSDILGVLQTQADTLDNDYLNHWAATLQVSDLLEKARRDAMPQTDT